jgi:hypothetical protein
VPAGAGSDVVVGMADDAEGNWRSEARLIRELDAAGVRTLCVGDFFHRATPGLRDAAARVRAAAGSWESTVVHAHAAMGVAVAHWAGAPAVVATCHGWSPDRPPAFDLQDALALSLADAIHFAVDVLGPPGCPSCAAPVTRGCTSFRTASTSARIQPCPPPRAAASRCASLASAS